MGRQVSVIGGANASAQELRLASEVGRLLGEAGCVVLLGSWNIPKDRLPHDIDLRYADTAQEAVKSALEIP